MIAAGLLLLLSGWGIAIAALFILHGRAMIGFFLAGKAIEILGLALVFRGHRPVIEDHR